MLTWILNQAKMKPGYLIGGVPKNLPASADIGESPFFVIEADEYDCAFFDKRSKFVHYRPRTAILNNLEYDHADIFESITDIQKQFHHLIRTIPSIGRIIYPNNEKYLQQVIDKGCWSEQETLSLSNQQAAWRAELLSADGSVFNVYLHNQKQGEVHWQHAGAHNVYNGLAAIAAARHVGVSPKHAIDALNLFSGVKRRMELIFQNESLSIYDDFAHHPTAIEMTLNGLRKKVGAEKIIAVIEPRSNTMRMGTHKENLAASVIAADEVMWYQPLNSNGLASDWDLQQNLHDTTNKQVVYRQIEKIISQLIDYVKASAAQKLHIVIMSNGSFGGIHQLLTQTLHQRADSNDNT